MPRADELIAQVLEEGGVEFVFGLPGGATGTIFDKLVERRHKIRTVLVRHEQAAAIMADAYGRATGKPAVVMGQGVFIGSNAAFGIMEAMTSSAPMLVLTDTSDGNMAQRPANQSGAGEYGSIDLLSIFRAMTKYTTLAAHPKEAVLGTQLALKHAATGRPGPACVLLRSASVVGEVNPAAPPVIHPTAGYLNVGAPQPSARDIERTARLLAEAERPVLVAGQGARLARAGGRIAELAETLGMPVVTSYKGKSAIAETHPWSAGMMGVYGQRLANAVVGDADVVLVVGAKLTPQDTIRERPQLLDPGRQKILQVDIEPRNAGWSFPLELGLVGDARATLDLLFEAVCPLAPSAALRAERAEALRARKGKLGFYDDDPELTRDSAPVTPQRLVRLLQENLDPASLITLDAGNNRTWMAHLYQAQQADTIFAPGGLAGMGWALPAALALQLVHPDRPVVAVAGDGGFMMTLHALSTALQYDLPVVSVVMNDSALGMVRHHQDADRRIASEYLDTDFAALARAFGAQGRRITDSRELPVALREAQASRQTWVLDVVTDRGPSPDDFRADRRGATET
jgi:acetolactate synthase-1/2/3 large subunit